ncbi:MAG: PepSY domain-containing protein [Henriciella sp.]|nr:PepSY domain-containing protein [Henriciella sp.]
MPATVQAQLGNSFTADQARQARDRGAVIPLKDIFRRLKQQHGGYQIDANLYNRGNRQVYVIDWMTGKNERIRVEVDAKTGRVIG